MAKDENLLLAESQKPRFFYGYVIVVVCFLMSVVWWGTFHSFGVFFESLLVAFGWSRAVTASAHASHGVLWTVLGIFIARLYDKFGPRLVIGVCGFLGGLGYLLMSQISDVWQMYLLYGLVMSIGMGGFVTLLPIVARWFVRQRGAMTGVVFSGMGIGMVVFPLLISQLISVYDWRFTYVIVGIIVMVVIVAGAQFLRRDPQQVGLSPYGGDEIDLTSPASEAPGFTYREALRTSQFWLVGTLFFITLVCQATVTVHIVIHAIGMGASAINAARLLSVFGAFVIVGMNIIGMAADRIGNKSTLPINFMLITIAFILLVMTKEIWVLYLIAGVLGFVCGGVTVVYSPILAELFGLRSHGIIFATANCIGGFGAAFGTALAGFIFDVTGSYSLDFIILAVLAAVAVVVALFLRPLRSEEGGASES